MRTLAALSLLLLLAPAGFATDYYVSTAGVDSAGYGTSEADPFGSISYALTVAFEDSLVPHTIHVAAGTYDEERELFPLPMISRTTISGAGPGETILLSGDNSSTLVSAVSCTSWAVEGMTLQGGRAFLGGGVLVLQGRLGTLRNLEIRDCTADHPVIPEFDGKGGGLYASQAESLLVEHVLFRGNNAYNRGGGIATEQCSPTLLHITLSGNSCTTAPASAAVGAEPDPTWSLLLENSIVWGNGPDDDTIVSMDGSLEVNFSIARTSDGSAWGGLSNRADDPLFTDPSAGDYTLLTGSPAVDRADPYAPYELEPEPNGARANMGAWGNTPLARTAGAATNLPQGRWRLLALPVDPPDGGMGVLFEDEMGAPPSDSTWHAGAWYQADGEMIWYGEPEESGELGDPDPREPGLGFLIWQNVASLLTIHANGHAADQTAPIIVDMNSQADPSYSMVGNPFPYPVNLEDATIVFPTYEHTLAEAAAAGEANRWAWYLTGGERFAPTMGTLAPWQGAVVIAHDLDASGLKFQPVRNPSAGGDHRSFLDWSLTLRATALNMGTPAASEPDHHFGLGEGMADGYDTYDAPDIQDQFLDDAGFRVRFVPQESSPWPLFHDFRAADREWIPVWHGEAVVQGLAADSVRIQVTGIDTVEGVPPDGVDLFLAPSGWYQLGNPLPPMVDLRSISEVRLPLEEAGDGTEYARFSILALGNGWLDVPKEEPGAGPALAGRFELLSVAPNPFNPATRITFSLPRPGGVDMAVFDLLGRTVERRVLSDLRSGRHTIHWDAGELASGVYFLRLKQGSEIRTRKLVLMR